MPKISEFTATATPASGDFLIGYDSAVAVNQKSTVAQLALVFADTHNAKQTLTDGANITYNAASGRNAKVTLAGNRTLDAMTNPTDGERGVLTVIQDATGTRGLTLAAGYTVVAGAAASIASQAAAKRSWIEWIYDGGSSVVYCWITQEP
jgi:hypothetical protein